MLNDINCSKEMKGVVNLAIRVGLSFKETKEEKELYEFLKEKSEIIGESAYIKTLLQNEMQKENAHTAEGHS